MRLYFKQDGISLYLGDCREFSAPPCDLTLADPPYGETSLTWDQWPETWVDTLQSRSLWCFGSIRMLLEHFQEFSGWKFAQDIVWEKQNGSSFHSDRFRRVHEGLTHWYTGKWSSLHKSPVMTPDAVSRQLRRKHRPPHMGHIGEGAYESQDGGPRMMRSVIYARNCHGYAEHPTQKPVAILQPLIEYSCPPNGLVYVPFAGVGSELVAARFLGRKAIGVEIDERYCEAAANRLSSYLPIALESAMQHKDVI